MKLNNVLSDVIVALSEVKEEIKAKDIVKIKMDSGGLSFQNYIVKEITGDTVLIAVEQTKEKYSKKIYKEFPDKRVKLDLLWKVS